MELYFEGFCLCIFFLVVHSTCAHLWLLPVDPQELCLASPRITITQDQALYDGPTQPHNLTPLPLISQPDSIHGRQSSLLILKTHRSK